MRFCLLILLALFSLAVAAGQQAFLIQNSGWMEPFYSDPNSQFRPLVLAVIQAVSGPEDQIFVSAFNQSAGGSQSPMLVFASGQSRPLEESVAAIAVAKKTKTSGLADTDFEEAVTKTIIEQFQTKPGIVWIFTNNKNSPNNDAETAKRNRQFYHLIHNEPSIVRTVVFPLGMPVKGTVYQANGLMVYAMAYGQEADAQLRELLQSGRIMQVFTGQSARLKPLDRESVRLVPKEIRNGAGSKMKVSLAADQHTVVLDVAASEQQPSVEIVASLENLFYPYIIQAADISAQFTIDTWSNPLSVEPQNIVGLEPSAQREIKVNFPIPLAKIPSIWSSTALGSLGKTLKMHGTVDIGLNNQQIVLSETFRRNLNELFPGDPISEVFSPPTGIQSSFVKVPIIVQINYPIYPIFIIGLGLLALIGLVFFAFMLAAKQRYYEIEVDGRLQKFKLKPFQSQELHADTGEVIAKIQRRMTKLSVSDKKPGHSVNPIG